MSLNIRHLTNGEKALFTVSNTGVTPAVFEIFNKRDDIDKSIRHYAPSGNPVFCDPELAHIFGVLYLFYPNHPNCVKPEYSGKICIAKSCKWFKKCSLNHSKESSS